MFKSPTHSPLNMTNQSSFAGPSSHGQQPTAGPSRDGGNAGDPQTSSPRGTNGDRPLTLEAAFPWLMSQLSDSPSTDSHSLPPTSRPESQAPLSYDDSISLLFSGKHDSLHSQPQPQPQPSGVTFPAHDPILPLDLNGFDIPETKTTQFEIPRTEAKEVVPMTIPSSSSGPSGWTMWDLSTGQIPIDQVAPDLTFPHNFISSRTDMWSGSEGQYSASMPHRPFQSLDLGQSNTLPDSLGAERRDDGPAKKRGRNTTRRDSDIPGLSGRGAQSLGGNEVSPKRRGKGRVEPREIMEIRSRRFRDRAPKVIKERVHKVMAQRMYLLDRAVFKEVDEAQEFTLMGTKGDKAVVSIDHEPRCDCTDWLKGNAPCEHLIYVFLKILKIPEQSYLWFQKGLLSHELRDIFENTRNPTELPPTLLASMSQHLSTTTQQASGAEEIDEMDGPLAPLVGTDCQICFDAFTAEDIRTDRLAYDEKIQRMVHRVCFDHKTSSGVKPRTRS